MTTPTITVSVKNNGDMILFPHLSHTEVPGNRERCFTNCRSCQITTAFILIRHGSPRDVPSALERVSIVRNNIYINTNYSHASPCCRPEVKPHLQFSDFLFACTSNLWLSLMNHLKTICGQCVHVNGSQSQWRCVYLLSGYVDIDISTLRSTITHHKNKHSLSINHENVCLIAEVRDLCQIANRCAAWSFCADHVVHLPLI